MSQLGVPDVWCGDDSIPQHQPLAQWKQLPTTVLHGALPRNTDCCHPHTLTAASIPQGIPGQEGLCPQAEISRIG